MLGQFITHLNHAKKILKWVTSCQAMLKMLELYQTSMYKKQLKKYKHQHHVLQELKEVTRLLVNELPIPVKYQNHKLTGEHSGIMELHLKPDDLLMYVKIVGKSITLFAIGSHADLFG